jgi:SAM-dependent methyltransferase
MKFIRELTRNIKYNLKFLNKQNQTLLNYTSNSSINSKLTNLMNYYGSDKGGKNNHHNYSDYYSEIFFNRRKEVKNFLEIGLGTNNVNLASNMGKDGVPLASLKAWRDYFENANIYGADIDKEILKSDDRIQTFFVDQTNPETISLMFKNIGVSKFDVILEDGLHEYNANICFFENSIKFLSDDGVYIIEDVYFKDKIKFINYFKNSEYNYSIVDIYHKKNIANNCAVVVRKNV